MQEICPREKCTGCAACYNVCPKNCIQMKENEYGEVQPFIAEKECIDCGSCRRVCPNVDEKYISLLNPKAEVCYAAARKEMQKMQERRLQQLPVSRQPVEEIFRENYLPKKCMNW